MTSGYSGTPPARKLGLKEEHVLLLVDAPRGWTVPDLPAGVRIRRTPGSEADVVIAFMRTAATLEAGGPGLARRLASTSSLWIAWPRRAGGHASDVTEQLIRDVLLPVGVVDVKVAAIDDDWSGLKFVWRRENRR